MKKKMKKREINKISVKRLVIIFFALNIGFFLIMLLASTIPYSVIEDRVEEAKEIVMEEGDYPQYCYSSPGAKVNNSTDAHMLQYLKPLSNNIFKIAVVEHYPRYWYGHQAFLRTLFVFFDWGMIRYINMFLFYGAAVLFLCTLKEKLGALMTIFTFAAFVSSYFTVLPMAVSSLGAPMIIFMSCTLLLKRYGIWEEEQYACFFLTVGAVFNCFVGLNIPLLSMGLPMLYYFYMKIKEKKGNLKENLIQLIKFGALWGVGYGGTWVFKWILASVVLKTNIISNAANQAVYRMGGDVKEPVNLLRVFSWNIWIMFKPLLGLWIVLAILWFLLFCFFRKKTEEILSFIPIVLIGASPYVWYLILANHSQLHYWSTFRLQILTVIALLVFWSSSIDWKKVKEKIRKN